MRFRRSARRRRGGLSALDLPLITGRGCDTGDDGRVARLMRCSASDTTSPDEGWIDLASLTYMRRAVVPESLSAVWPMIRRGTLGSVLSSGLLLVPSAALEVTPAREQPKILRKTLPKCAARRR